MRYKRVRRVLEMLWGRFCLPPSDLCIAHEFHRPPYGGGNQFCLALAKEFESRGLKISRGLSARRARTCLFNSYNFDKAQLVCLKRNFDRMVHRVDGPIDVYRGNDKPEVDLQIHQVNHALADFTVFQSEYSMRRHSEMGLDFVNPTVIHNAVDPGIFYKAKESKPLDGGKTRLITVNWSDNANKGGAFLQQMEGLIDWKRYEWLHLGRTRSSFKRIRTTPPVDSQSVADHLRSSHILVTASLHESCSNAVLEALACGLPVAYIKSGSNAELVGEGGAGFSTPEEAVAAVDKIDKSYDQVRSMIRIKSICEVADLYAKVLFDG